MFQAIEATEMPFSLKAGFKLGFPKFPCMIIGEYINGFAPRIFEVWGYFGV